MANYCWNTISLVGEKDSIKELSKRLTDTYDKFDYLNGWCDYVLKIIDDFNYIKDEDKRDYYHYGSKWFDFDVDVDDDCITIQGDSAWGSMEKFTEELCRVYNLSGTIEYEEPGCDFGGYASYIGEEEVDSGNFTYMEWKYITDSAYWLVEMMDRLYQMKEEYWESEFKDASEYASKKDLKQLELELERCVKLDEINFAIEESESKGGTPMVDGKPVTREDLYLINKDYRSKIEEASKTHK